MIVGFKGNKIELETFFFTKFMKKQDRDSLYILKNKFDLDPKLAYNM